MGDKTFVGVDLGGTTVTAGIVARSELLSVRTVSTGANRPAEKIYPTILDLIDSVRQGASLNGIGIGVPNPAGPASDRLVLVENIPSLEGFPLKSRLQDHFGIPVALENDANCMALGEYRAGALKGCSDAVCLTLGTGLGCGIIIGGRLYRGTGYCAGEIWNIPYDGDMVLEDTVNLRRLKELTEIVSGAAIPLRTLHDRYRKGEPDAIEVFTRYGEAVGHVAVMVLSFLDPEKIAVGGGIAQAFDAFRDSMVRVVERTWGEQASARIVPAALSEKAAILGAAALALEIVNG